MFYGHFASFKIWIEWEVQNFGVIQFSSMEMKSIECAPVNCKFKAFSLECVTETYFLFSQP